VCLLNKSASLELSGLTGHTFGMGCARLAQEAQHYPSSAAAQGLEGHHEKLLSPAILSSLQQTPQQPRPNICSHSGAGASSWLEDGQDHTAASLPLHCLPLCIASPLPLSRFQRGLWPPSLSGTVDHGLRGTCDQGRERVWVNGVCLGRAVGDAGGQVWRQRCAQQLPGVRRARGSSRPWVVGEQSCGGLWPVCVQG